MKPKNVPRESPVVAVAVAAVVVVVAAVVVVVAADHAAGKPVSGSGATRHSPHFFELRDNVDRCRIAGF